MIAQVVTPVNRWYRFVLVGILLIAAIAGYALPGERKIDSLNFSNADITLVLKALADLGNTNIVIGPAVKGPITIKLTDVTVDEALQVITKQAGLSYGMYNGAYVVNDPATIASLTPQAYEIVKLKALTAAEAISALGITFKDVQAKELPDHRLVISGDEKRLKAALIFIGEIDVMAPKADVTPINQGWETAEVIYKVKSVVAWQAKQYLEDLYGAQGLTVAFAPKQMWQEAAATRTALDSTPAPAAEKSANATANAPAATPAAVATPAMKWESNELILRGAKPVVEQAIVSLAKVDVEVKLAEVRRSVKRVYASQAIVYLLEQFEAKGLTIVTAPMTFADVTGQVGEGTKTLSMTEGGGKTSQIGTVVRRDKDGKLNVSEPIGDFILRGPESVVKEADAVLPLIDVGPVRVEHLYSLRFLDTQDAKKRLDELFSADGLITTIGPGRRGETPNVVENTAQASVTASGGASSSAGVEIFDLVLRGPEEIVAQAEQMLAKLDAEPLQISVKAEIININSSEVNNLGVQWAGTDGKTATPNSVTAGLSEAQSGDPLQLGRIVRNPIALNVTLNALQSSNKAKIISRPSTVVQNGREALIHAGDKIFYEMLTSFSNGTPVYSQQSIDTGVTLKVRPLMSKDGIITLEMTTNVTQQPTFHKGVSGSDLPTISGVSTTNVVQVRPDETLVIGGLRQMSQQEVQQRVPFLSKIPLLGMLFKNKQTTPSETELLILVTPSVLHGPATAPAIP